MRRPRSSEKVEEKPFPDQMGAHVRQSNQGNSPLCLLNPARILQQKEGDQGHSSERAIPMAKVICGVIQRPTSAWTSGPSMTASEMAEPRMSMIRQSEWE